ncbi:MAG: hypothetical protein N2746_07130 [Deltaproteobacteria bacterium]|nr:hypothetical protein [Deltaproteobacteria bacterium]
MFRKAIVFMLVLIFSMALSAGSIYLNGVKIDGVRDQEFKSVNVKIDKDGNIHISAPGYIVKTGDEQSQKASSPVTQAKSYFLVTQISTNGRGGYDIDLFINGNWIRKISNKDEQIVMDLTKHLQSGKNTIRLTGVKSKDSVADPLSTGFTEVIVGEGTAGKNNVVIDKPLINYKFFAKDANPIIKDFEIEAIVK